MTPGHPSRARLLGLSGSLLAHLAIGAALVVALASAPDRRGGPATGSPSATSSQEATGPRGFSGAVADATAAGASGAALGVERLAFAVSAAAKAEASSPRLWPHLWESTIFAAVVAVLTMLFRRHGAHVRYWFWLAASMKFFVPFSALAALGSYAGALMPARPVTSRLPWLEVPGVDRFMTPMLPTDWVPAPAPGPSVAEWSLLIVCAMWVMGMLAIGAMRFRLWRRVSAALRTSTPLNLPHVELPAGVEVRASAGLLEPGVIGWRRPVLLVPKDIEQHLSASQLEAVIAHELCHIARRDNLTAALHMVTETVFWFHPAVWWIGARLLVERERACDEAVVAGGCEPATYAHAIVNTCALYTTSPVACVAGVTGSDLRRRVEAILKNDQPKAIKPWVRRAAFAGGALLLVLPIVRGMDNGPVATIGVEPLMAFTGDGPPAPSATGQAAVSNEAQDARFVVVSIRRNPGGGPTTSDVSPGGRFIAVNMPVRLLIGQVYDVQSSRLKGGPDWIETDRYDIEARADRDLTPGRDGTLNAALRGMLEDRFGLVLRRESQQMPVLELVRDRADGPLGPNLTPSTRTDCEQLLAARNARGGGGPGPPPPPPGPGPGGVFEAPPCGARTFTGMVVADSLPLSFLAGWVGGEINRPGFDRTGLSGRYNYRLTWTPDQLPPPDSGLPAIDPNGPPLSTALKEQLGLRIESTTGPVDVVIIERIERPAPN